MKGRYSVLVQDKRLRYQFEICRNITIIRGDSATGKTTLLEMLAAYELGGEESGIEVRCEKPCRVLTGVDWKDRLAGIRGSLVFMDEIARFTSSEDFAAAIRGSDNYYVIVTREPLANLPYSVTEVYGIRTSGKYAGLKQTWNEFYHIYGDVDPDTRRSPQEVIVEDSNAGFDFFCNVYGEKGISCFSAKGKSNIYGMLLRSASGRILVIADGAAFGCEMERIMRLIEGGMSASLYLPESFEWIILRSGLFRDADIPRILDAPEDYVESSRFFSWEQYFTALLVQRSDGTWLKYGKKKLNPAYLNDHERGAIRKVMEKLM